MQESILNWLPPADGKRSYRLQASLTLEEAAALEHLLADLTLPFAGDQSMLVRTFIRAGIARLHEEREEKSDTFLQSMAPLVGSELLKWSANACDSFAVACVDHIGLASESGDPTSAEQVVEQVTNTIEQVKNQSARAMLKRALLKRGFMAAVARLRQVLLDNGHNVYWLDTTIAEAFA